MPVHSDRFLYIMSENGNNKPNGPSKSFMTVGPTLHYSHANVHRCWALAVAIYVAACFFWSVLVGVSPLMVNFADIVRPELWDLGKAANHPLSIYEYPWQIVVLGSLMGILATTPLLVSQLLRFRYSIPMLLALVFIARLPMYGVCVIIGSIAVACRPLRFRSRIIAVALCMAPSLIYWAVFGGTENADPIQWGFSYAPWVYAWLVGLFFAALVLGIGHYMRYRPGLVWIFSLLILAATFSFFQKMIGFAELDYQLYVAENNPEEQVEFHTHSLTRHIDAVIQNETMRSYLTGRFYPTEPILLREKLKDEMQNLLLYNRWPQWFQKKMPGELKYEARRSQLLAQYDRFLERRPGSKRVPIALYYKALLKEYHPDVRSFGQTEMLQFYNDYPFYENILIWQELLRNFPQSPEALEARRRIAMREAGQGHFDKATELCEVALKLLDECLLKLEQPVSKEGIFTAFHEPSQSVMTRYKLQQELRPRLQRLKLLISRMNQGTTDEEQQRLARFVMLNPYSLNYDQQLDELLGLMKETDPIRDNVLLARAKLIPDAQMQAKTYQSLSETYANTDGGIQALFELGLLKVQQWKEIEDSSQQKKDTLAEARTLLTRFLETYPDSIFRESALRMLESLPQGE